MAMEIIRNDVWLCASCLFPAVNGETLDGDSDEQIAATEKGLTELGPHLVPNFDSETEEGILDFSWSHCDCCGSDLGGSRHRFAILGEVAESERKGE